ncbi:ABC transporter ATP-binding protein, partial [Pseudomonas syringae pv. tagetis]
YNALIAEYENASDQLRELEEGSVQTRSGSGDSTIGRVRLHKAAGELIEYVYVCDPVSLRNNAQLNRAIPELVEGYQIKDRQGQPE